MFGFGGTPKTHGQLAKEEFNAGVDHMRLAAQYAAGGMGSAMGPRVHNVRSMVSPAAGRVRTAATSRWDSTVTTLAPIMAAAREGAREATEAALKAKARDLRETQRLQKEEQVNRQRMGLALGLLAAGAAVGAAAALIVRRRRRSAWEDYDPSEALESMMDSVSEAPSDMKSKSSDVAAEARATGSQLSEKAGDAVQRAADKTADAVEKTGDKTSSAMNKAADTSERMR